MNKTWKHEKSGAELCRPVAQPHVESFGEVFPDWRPYQLNSKKASENHAARRLGSMIVGPYCRIEGGLPASVSCADWVLSRMAERTIDIPNDRMTFSVIDHENGWSLVVANHSKILGDVWLAYIRTETVPQVKDPEPNQGKRG